MIGWHLKLLTAAAIGLPLHYAAGTRLGRPVIHRLMRALTRTF